MVDEEDNNAVADQIAALQRAIQALQLQNPTCLPNVSLPVWKGRTDSRSFREFLRDYYKIAQALGWSEQKCCNMIVLCLRGEAYVIYQGLTDDQKSSWKMLCEAICGKLYNEQHLGLQRSSLQRRVQRDGESIAEFGAAIKELVDVAYPSSKNFTDNHRKELAIQCFRNGLKPSLKAQVMRKTAPASLSEAIDEAIAEEQLQEELRADRLRNDYEASSIRAEAKTRELQEKVDGLELQVCSLSNTQQNNNGQSGTFGYQRPRGPPAWQRGSSFGRFFQRPRNLWQNRRNFFSNRGKWVRPFGRRPFSNQGPPPFRRGPPQSTNEPVQYQGPQRSFDSRNPQQRSSRRGGYKINSVDTSHQWSTQREQIPCSSPRCSDFSRIANAAMPLLTFIALFCLTSAQYQICLETNGGLLVSPPEKQSCIPPPVDRVQRVIVEIFVPKISPTTVPVYRCINETRTLCTKSILGLTQSSWIEGPTRSSVKVNACWDTIKLGRTPDGRQLIHQDSDLWLTKNPIIQENAVFGQKCVTGHNLVVLRGQVGSVDGKTMVSNLENFAGCTLTNMSCTKTESTVVWEAYDSKMFCGYESTGVFEAMMSNRHILVESIQAAFLFANKPVHVEVKQCLSPPLFQMENQVVIRFLKHKSLPLSTRPKRDAPPIYQMIYYEDDDGNERIGYAFVDPQDPAATYPLVKTVPDGAIIRDFNGKDRQYCPVPDRESHRSQDDASEFLQAVLARVSRSRQTRDATERPQVLTALKYRKVAFQAPDGKPRIAYVRVNDTPGGTQFMRWKPPVGAVVINFDRSESVATEDMTKTESALTPEQELLLKGKNDTERRRIEKALRAPLLEDELRKLGRPMLKVPYGAVVKNGKPSYADYIAVAPTATEYPRVTTLSTVSPVPTIPSYAEWKQKAASKKAATTNALATVPTTTMKTSTAPTTDLATSPTTSRPRHQYTNEVNSRMQFAFDKLQMQEYNDYRHLWRQICELHNSQVAIVSALLRLDPTSGMRLWMKQDNIHAKFVGEALLVSGCKQITPDYVYWNNTVNETCYAYTPLLSNGTILFIQPGTRELTTHSETVPCDKRPTIIYQNSSGSWRGEHGDVHVNSLSRHMLFKHYRPTVEFRSPDIFRSDTAEVAMSVSLLAT